MQDNRMNRTKLKTLFTDLLYAILAGIVVGTAYHFFQNSNGFAPGGVGGLATITHYLLSDLGIGWGVLMIAFNLPIFILVSALIDKKLGLMLSVYLFVQSFLPDLYELLGANAYSLQNNPDDFNIVLAAVATGVVSGFGFSLMLRRFGASGGTYGISALLKKRYPALNIAYVSFIMDTAVVAIAFFVYGMRVTPTLCTLVNLFVANVIVDHMLGGVKCGYKFEIVTTHPDELSRELMEKLHHGVTEIRVHGMYSDTDRFMLVCIINKRQIGDMMRIIKKHPDTFASFERVTEVFGNFKRSV